MFTSATVWLDFAGSLAIVFVLALIYAQVQRLFYSQQHGKMLLGLAFGGVAWLQMNLPIEPMEGLIIDLRNIPLVLCGAFLGWRGSLLCFAIAASTRIGIGGIGMMSGLLGMMIALSVGGAWAHVTRSLPKRSLRHMILLSMLGSLHLSAAMILPDAARTWFYLNASLPIALLNLVSITLAASLLDAEQRKIERENRLAASVSFDPDHGALTKPAFEREISLRVSAGTMAPPAALLVVKLRYAEVLFSIIPDRWRNKALGLVRERLKDAFVNADLVCTLGTTALVVPLDETQLLGKTSIQDVISNLMRGEPFQFSDSISKFLTVETNVQLWPSEKSLDEVLISARFSLLPKRKDRHPWKSPIRGVSGRKGSSGKRKHQTQDNQVTHSTTEALFEKAAFLMRPGEGHS